LWFKKFKKSEFVFERDRPFLSSAEINERKKVEYLQLSVDATFKGGVENDFVAMGLRGIYRGGVYQFHQVNKRLTFVQTMEKLKWFFKEYPEIDELVIEDKANGPAIADVLRYTENVPPIVTVNPMGGKVSRAEAITPFISAGNYYIAEDLDENDVDWHVATTLSAYDKIVTQHKSFPYGKHDDMVDENSQGTIRLIKLITGEEPKAERRFLRYTKWYPDMWDDFEQMTPTEQEKFIQTYGAPLEWMPD
jgi:predicted phage terminase large subunit-like protein